MTEADSVIDVLNYLKEASVEPYTYTLDDLKAQIDAVSETEKYTMLKSIIEEGGSAISQCDAFELFVHTDPWNTLRDLLEEDPSRTSFKFRGALDRFDEPLVYENICFTTPFWQYEPTERTDSEWENLFLFTEGVLRPRSKQLKYHSCDSDDQEEDCYTTPTHDYINDSDEGKYWESNDMYESDEITYFRIEVTF